uniref:Protein-tyrosine phosphatase n=1 Tax=Ditylenchus dipsaci TaxID=166011 RepID=A0A915EVP0_9BILA
MNPTKCRYKDIICLDASRVVLQWPAGTTEDFVHANWVTHELFENRFICSQAPLDSTVGDFWRICWQENVRQIIMLCRCEELGKAKCAQYWPVEVDEQKTMTYGLTITCQKIDRSDKNFIHTRLLLSCGQESRRVDHRQWTTWPDKSVPQTPLAPFRLLQYTRKQNKYPSLIHCSAGVGRTGTMVAIEMIYKSLSSGIVPDSSRLLQNLRSQRHLAVQTEDQYVYCHYAIIQFAYAKKMAAKHDVKLFCKEYNHTRRWCWTMEDGRRH